MGGMDDIVSWMLFASFAGFSWSFVTWVIAYAREQKDQLDHFEQAFGASCVLGVAVCIVGFLMASPGFDPTVSMVGGALVGGVSGVFTAFGIMRGKPPD